VQFATFVDGRVSMHMPALLKLSAMRVAIFAAAS